MSVELGPSERLVLSAMTKRAALSAPVRTISSRSMLSPTLIGLVVAATRATSF
ncbi:ribosomal protein S19 [Bradyrhizobium sp. USDA 4486]